MNKEDLKQFVTDNSHLVSMKPCGEGMFVLKYKKRVFFDNLWNDFLEECRGTIVDADFNIVSYPFTKIYNYGVEEKAPTIYDDEMVTAYRKVNGFMVAVTWHNNDLLVSTTGSTDSDYVKMAKELIEPTVEWYRETCSENPNVTFMFECVHRNDPHIVPEKEGMYLLGARKKQFGSGIMTDLYSAGEFGCYHVDRIHAPMEYVKLLVKHVKHEGFVIYSSNGATKIKSPYYLTSKWVARNPRTDKIMNLQADIKQHIDEEYYPLIDAIRENIVEYTALDEQGRLAWVRNFLDK